MQNSADGNRVSSDEIDLRELFLVLRNRKKMIYGIVVTATLIAAVLAFFIMKPIYSVKSMIEIGTIVGGKKSNTPLDSYVEDIKQKISYTYRIGEKGVKRELPYVATVTLPKDSKNILSLEVLARNNKEGIKYLQTISDKIISDANKKTYAHIEETKRQIELFENDLLSSNENYKNIKNSIGTMNQKVASLSKIDPALAAIYALQVSQKDLTLSEIKNTMITIKNKIEELKDSISTNNVEFTKMIDKIQVLENPIKPKKALIVVVAFIASLIFSIFLIFFLNYIEGMKKEDA